MTRSNTYNLIFKKREQYFLYQSLEQIVYLFLIWEHIYTKYFTLNYILLHINQSYQKIDLCKI